MRAYATAAPAPQPKAGDLNLSILFSDLGDPATHSSPSRRLLSAVDAGRGMLTWTARGPDHEIRHVHACICMDALQYTQLVQCKRRVPTRIRSPHRPTAGEG